MCYMTMYVHVFSFQILTVNYAPLLTSASRNCDFEGRFENVTVRLTFVRLHNRDISEAVTFKGAFPPLQPQHDVGDSGIPEQTMVLLSKTRECLLCPRTVSGSSVPK